MDEEIFQYLDGKGGFGTYWGFLDTASSPWIHSETFGWMYLDSGSTEQGYWLWFNNNLGWIYSSAGLFPEAYWNNRDSMILFDFTERNRIKFWEFNERKWIVTATVGESYKGTYDPVPAELRGLVHESVDIWDHIDFRISVESYYVEIFSVHGLGTITEIWYYDSSKERFYLLESTEPDLPWSYLEAGSVGEALKIEKISDNLVLTYESEIFDTEPDVRTYPITRP
jgi:hypothetical protein